MRSRPRRPQFPSRPEGSSVNVTSAIGMEETVGRHRARRTSLFTHTVMWVTGLICTAFLLGTLAQAWSNSQLSQQLREEQQKYQQVQAHYEQLNKQVKQYQDPAVVESEARQQLGYIRPGEHPVVVVGANKETQQKTQKSANASVQQGFWQEWWSTFFNE